MKLLAKSGLPMRAANALLAKVFASKVQFGRLLLELPNAQKLELCGTKPGADAALKITSWKAFYRVMQNADLGFADAYIAGECETEDLAALFTFILQNVPHDEKSVINKLRPVMALRHALNRNSRVGSRRNIMAHYDLGNAFYAQWLDQTMSYSSGLYVSPDQSLEHAQYSKIDRAIELLEPHDGQDVLEIGCGWGGLASRLVQAKDVRFTGITLSPAQLQIARERTGDSKDVAIELRDYRDVTGVFDRIVSIEMIEAVGAKYWPAYFSMLGSRLRSQGIAVLQAITIAEDRFKDYCEKPDFIQKYIFPGGMLPTRDLIRSHAQAAGLKLVETQLFGQSYAKTLGEWQVRFQAAWPAIAELGFDLKFKRMWEYYLDYCKAGFEHGSIDVGFYKLVRS